MISIKGKNILITGASGYLAANLQRALSTLECSVSLMSRSKKTRYTDRSLWDKALAKMDFVFHFAAQTDVAFADQNPDADYEANVYPMLQMLESCRTQKKRPVILYSGTVTQMGVPVKLPVNETPVDRPITVYDLHKLMAERMLLYYCRKGFARGASLRLANVYGPGPRSSSANRGVINQMIVKALKGETLTVYGDGKEIRDYIYVQDVVSAFIAAAENGSAVNGRYFVIGSGQGHSIADTMALIAKTVAQKKGRRTAVKHVPPPAQSSPINKRNFVADSTRFRKATRWNPKTDLQTGLALTAEALCPKP